MGEVITQPKTDIAWADTQRASHISKNCLGFCACRYRMINRTKSRHTEVITLNQQWMISLTKEEFLFRVCRALDAVTCKYFFVYADRKCSSN